MVLRLKCGIWMGVLIACGMLGVSFQVEKLRGAPGCNSMILWKNRLCCGQRENITVWKDFHERILFLRGHHSLVVEMEISGNFLFSASWDRTIRKWNERGDCMA